ncbi:MAG: hypothetical protein HEEMFOPI_01362 [Holosporales bacterium]
MNKKLLIISSDYISSWVKKGEVVPRYYNPGNLFDEVHIMMTNDDKPDPKLVQPMVGNAKLFLYNYPEPDGFLKKTLGWQPWLMRKWAKGVIPIVNEIDPSLIRCHGAHLNSFIASYIKKNIKIPYVVSLHINPDENFRKNTETFKEKIIFNCLKKIERIGLKNADLVMPVYEPIVPYLKTMGINRFKVCYNVINEKFALQIKNYSLSLPARLIYIGNLHFQKNPINIIEAIKDLNVRFTIIGDGNRYDSLLNLSKELGLDKKISFNRSIDNENLVDILLSHDIVVLNTKHFEFSKVMIESSLLGMPIITNKLPRGLKVPELSHDNCLYVNDTVDGYRIGIQELIDNEQKRREIGIKARSFALEKCDPVLCEKRYAEIYNEFMIHRMNLS